MFNCGITFSITTTLLKLFYSILYALSIDAYNNFDLNKDLGNRGLLTTLRIRRLNLRSPRPQLG